MEIRPLALEDLLLCESFGHAFHAEKAIPGAFSLEVFLKNWSTFLGSGIGTIFGLWNGMNLVGGIGGIVVADLTTGELVVNELFWYVDPAFRKGSWPIRLLHEFRRWGREKGAVRLRMVHILMPNESASTVRLAHVYRNMGLRPIEVAYDGPIGV